MMGSMPKVRASSAMIGTMNLPILWSFSRCRNMVTNPIIAESDLPLEPASHSAKSPSGGASK